MCASVCVCCLINLPDLPGEGSEINSCKMEPSPYALHLVRSLPWSLDSVLLMPVLEFPPLPESWMKYPDGNVLRAHLVY